MMLATYHLMLRLWTGTVLCLYLDIQHSKAVRHVYNFEVYLYYTNISVIKHYIIYLSYGHDNHKNNRPESCNGVVYKQLTCRGANWQYETVKHKLWELKHLIKEKSTKYKLRESINNFVLQDLLNKIVNLQLL